ncbi:Hpt domain-containing protein [Roseivivax marinus]|nr:Hpt domain-containing protein [Roseivivax marinus]
MMHRAGRQDASGRMIDWDQVTQLRAEIGADEFEEVASLFLQEVATALDALDPAAPGLAEDLHFLKGAALNLGLAYFAALCAAGEKQAAKGERPVGLDCLGAVFRDSRAALRVGLKARFAA